MGAPEWVSLEEGESVEWVGEPGVASKMDLLVFGAAILPAFGLGLLILVPGYLAVRSTEYVVTDRAVYVKSGFLRSSVERVAYEDLRSTGYDESFWEQGSGRGTVELYASPSPVADVELAAVPDGRALEERIRELSDTADAGQSGDAGGVAESAGVDVASLRAVREDLSRALDALGTVETTVGDGESSGDGGGGAAAELARYRQAVETARSTVDRTLVATLDDEAAEGIAGDGDGRPAASVDDLGAVADGLAETRESLETIEAALAREASAGGRDAP